MNKSKQEDSNLHTSELVNGNVTKGLIKLTIPMILTNLLNVAYNIVDTIWIGQIIGSKGLGAISVSYPIMLILFSIITGTTIAISILVGQYFGAKDYKNLLHVSKVSTTLSLILSLFLAVLGYIFTPAMMRFLNTPQSIMEYSVSYFRITMLGFPFLFYYFLVSSLLRGIGDTVRPLIFLCISTVINLILDPLMIKGIGPFPAMGLNGAAYATVFSQFISAVLGMMYLKIKNSAVKANPFDTAFDSNIIKCLIKIGIPFAAAQLIKSVSWTLLNRLINTYGESASASIAVSIRIDSLTFLPLIALYAGIAAMSAQNIGAGRMDRIKDIFKSGTVFALIISSLITLTAVLFPEFIVRMFTKDMSILEYAKSYMYVVTPSSILLSIMFSANGIINGAGKNFYAYGIFFYNIYLNKSSSCLFIIFKNGLMGDMDCYGCK